MTRPQADEMSPIGSSRSHYLATIREDGFALVPDCLTPEQVAGYLAAVEIAVAEHPNPHGVRNLLRAAPELREIPGLPAIRRLVEPVLGPEAQLTRAILFDKTPKANWRVGWHQDLIIAVRERVEAGGFTAWSVKDGVPHVHPPVGVLEQMLTLRLHLDECGKDNGALRVVPGSHRHGRLADDEMRRLRQEQPAVTCALPAGGALAMRLLLMHASAPAADPTHRRVIHLDFAGVDLPPPLACALRHRAVAMNRSRRPPTAFAPSLYLCYDVLP